MEMAGAGIAWWEHAVKKIMQPDRPFILAPHKGTTAWEERPSHLWNPPGRLKGPCPVAATDH